MERFLVCFFFSGKKLQMLSLITAVGHRRFCSVPFCSGGCMRFSHSINMAAGQEKHVRDTGYNKLYQWFPTREAGPP